MPLTEKQKRDAFQAGRKCPPFTERQVKFLSQALFGNQSDRRQGVGKNLEQRASSKH